MLTSSTKFVGFFFGRSVNKNVRLGRFLKKVAHCSRVHDMWPFGPLVNQAETTYTLGIQRAHVAPTKERTDRRSTDKAGTFR